MKKQSDVVSRTSRFVTKLFRERLPGWIRYHDLAHTSEVVAATKEIGTGSRLNENQMEVVLIAAWLHDTGYTVLAKGHEEVSVEIATEFLRGIGYPERGIARVTGCIRATRVPQRPRTLMERVLADADLVSLGKRSFFRLNDRLKLEIELREGVILEDRLWLRRSHRFLKNHRFHTPYGRGKIEKGRLANVAKLKRMLEER